MHAPHDKNSEKGTGQQIKVADMGKMSTSEGITTSISAKVCNVDGISHIWPFARAFPRLETFAMEKILANKKNGRKE